MEEGGMWGRADKASGMPQSWRHAGEHALHMHSSSCKACTAQLSTGGNAAAQPTQQHAHTHTHTHTYLRRVMLMRRSATGGTQCMAWSPPAPLSTRQEPAAHGQAGCSEEGKPQQADEMIAQRRDEASRGALSNTK